MITWILSSRKEKYVPWLSEMDIEITLEAPDVSHIKRSLARGTTISLHNKNVVIGNAKGEKQVLKDIVTDIKIKTKR